MDLNTVNELSTYSLENESFVNSLKNFILLILYSLSKLFLYFSDILLFSFLSKLIILLLLFISLFRIAFFSLSLLYDNTISILISLLKLNILRINIISFSIIIFLIIALLLSNKLIINANDSSKVFNFFSIKNEKLIVLNLIS